MKTSYNALKSYNVPDSHFFINRMARNDYFAQQTGELTEGAYSAIGADLSTLTDLDAEVWDLDMYNGINWTLQSIDPNYSLVVTNEGLKAITYLKQGVYKLEITAIKIRESNIVNPAVPLIQWTGGMFEAYGDIILDTRTNASFSIRNNLSWRSNMANGGIQFSITLDPDTYGEIGGNRRDEYTVGSIGLYVQDPTDTGKTILFAIGNLNRAIPKYSTTASRMGNSIRLLLNTVVSNLGFVADVKNIVQSVNSIPEVMNDEQLITTYTGTESPFNIYLVDNLAGSNIPALAIRKGNPAITDVTWEYITPRDDTITLEDAQIADNLKDYMVATWDETNKKFVPATSRDGKKARTAGNNLTGIKVGKKIIFAGIVANINMNKKYNFTVKDAGTRYLVGDILVANVQNDSGEGTTLFTLKVTNTDASGAITQYTITPTGGMYTINNESVQFGYAASNGIDNPKLGQNFTMSIISTDYSADTYIWNFPESWYNKPLYVHKTSGGTITATETEFFIGWCIGTGSNSKIKLALDLDDQASYVSYGTTRYATNDETGDVTGNSSVSEVCVAVPKNLQANYVQKTKIAGNPGENASNPVVVDSHIKFNQTIVGKGVEALPPEFDPSAPDSNVSFYGLAYRAWWGDLAEYYRSDRVYPAGTLITIGDGPEEITKAMVECNGIVSDKPGYELGNKKDEKDLPVALVGKVPVLFDGECMPQFGDKIYLSRKTPGKASNIPNGKCLGKIIDKGKDLVHQTTILCSVRISF